MARSALKHEEAVQTAHNISLKDIPIKREEFTQPVQSKITVEEIKQKLIDGMKGISSVGVAPRANLASTLAGKIFALDDDEKINAKVKEVLLALPQIAKAAGIDASDAFSTLSNDKIASLFAKYPQQFVEIAKAAGDGAEYTFKVFSNDKIASLFAKYPQQFVEIAKAAGSGISASGALFALSDDKVAELFVKYTPQFVEIAKSAGNGVWGAFSALSNDKIAKDFISWCEGKISKETFLIILFSSNTVATEIGRPLDDLHNEDLRNPNNKRTAYLNSLPKEKVLSLLCSNPEYFYTSSNNLLFDRFLKDIQEGKFNQTSEDSSANASDNKSMTGIIDVLQKYGLENTDLHRNLIFRAINYGRFYGGYLPVFLEKDADASMKALLSPLKNNTGFDNVYFYHLANCLENLTPSMKESVKNELISCKANATLQIPDGISGAKERLAASSFLLDYLANPLEHQVVFDPAKYRDKDGKLEIVQVFDKEDTGKDHWGFSQDWFAKYGAPKNGENGELIYETKTTRVTLYMGETEDDNQNFVKKKLSENTNMLLTFRGHSFSLDDNMPSNIFGNCDCKVLFIPGSCGSAGSTPAYLASNPKTDLDFISNTSTGRGQVTNALLDTFIAEDARIRAGKELRTYNAILLDNSAKINANGGDPATLKASALGEEMLERVYKET